MEHRLNPVLKRSGSFKETPEMLLLHTHTWYAWCLGETLQVQESKSDRNLCLFVDCIKKGLESEVDRLCIPFDFNVKQCKDRSKRYINVNIDYP